MVGKKCVFRPERNVGKVEQERTAIGSAIGERLIFLSKIRFKQLHSYCQNYRNR